MEENLRLKDFVHLYIGQKMLSYWGETEERQTIKGVVGNYVVFKNVETEIEDSLDMFYKCKKGKEPKLILRKLSSITAQEQAELEKIYDEEGIQNSPRQFNFLLKQGFDLFSLIEAGIAIEKGA